MEEIINEISYWCSRISFLMIVLSVIYQIVLMVLSIMFDYQDIPLFVNTMVNIIATISNFTLSFSGIISSLYGSKTLSFKRKSDENKILSFLHELKDRYKNSDLQLEALRILKELEDIGIEYGNELYPCFTEFHQSVRDNLIYRINVSSRINVLVWFFVLYNYFVLYVYYNKYDIIKPLYSRIIYLTLNVINPILSVFFSYTVVLCDSVNSILAYIEKVKELKERYNVKFQEGNKINSEIIDEIKDYTRIINQPFIYWWESGKFLASQPY